PCEGPDLLLGQPIRVRLVEADPDESRIRFEVDGS
ncbi:MAG: RNase II-type exonuclease C-terminal domain, partial [Actinomycetota bacterium]|nr:RNase II-type exonuclease C-terminal domain [Actinomycetota bacterium]